jgi:hypothetical protein
MTASLCPRRFTLCYGYVYAWAEGSARSPGKPSLISESSAENTWQGVRPLMLEIGDVGRQLCTHAEFALASKQSGGHHHDTTSTVGEVPAIVLSSDSVSPSFTS